MAVPLLVVIIALLVIGGGIYLYTQWNRITTVPNEITTTSAQTQATTSAVDTAGWQTYENDQYGIIFKYPPEWGTPSGQVISSRFDTMFEVTFPEPSPIRIDYVNGLKNNNGSTESFEQYLNTRRADFSQLPSFKETSMEIGGKSAVEFSMITPKGTNGSADGPLPEDYRDTQIVTNGSGGDIISIDYEYPLANVQYSIILNNVISTLNLTK